MTVTISGTTGITSPGGDIITTSLVVPTINVQTINAGSSNTLSLQTNNANALTINASQQASFVNNVSMPNTFGFKNRIINGGMTVSQYNGTSSVTVTNAYVIDRFAIRCDTGSSNTEGQSTTAPTGFINSLVFTTGTGASPGSSAQNRIYQGIEGLNVTDLGWGTANAKTVTLSFWVRSSLTGQFGGVLNNSAFNRSYPFTYTISSANTWIQISITIPGDTSGTWLTTNGVGIGVFFDLGMGSTFVPSSSAGNNTWNGSDYRGAYGDTAVVGTSGATFYITGVQLEVGAQATSFDYRPYGTELALCQRYCYCVPGTTAGDRVGGGFIFSSTGGIFYVYFPVYMRASPTLLGTPSPISLNDSTAAYAASAVTLNGSNVNFAAFAATSSGMTAYRGCQAYFTNTQTNTLLLTSEL